MVLLLPFSISIHALREESDDGVKQATAKVPEISIHALREESDKLTDLVLRAVTLFLSTPSARRATHFDVRTGKKYRFLSTPSARRATLLQAINKAVQPYFYPRPPRGERLIDFYYFYCPNNFYPRPPRGERLGPARAFVCVWYISIHALREESDTLSYTNASGAPGISIHALREESDLCFSFFFFCHFLFLSTPSARRATTDGDAQYIKAKISIHALREESDSKNREKTPCFCLIIHLSAQIAKRCL